MSFPFIYLALLIIPVNLSGQTGIISFASKDLLSDSLTYKSPVITNNGGSIRFPNAFRWNQSGSTGGYWSENQSDDNIFRPILKNVTSYRLRIFNRGGALIFESYDINKGWDGYLTNGSLAVQGVYIWMVKGRFADGAYFDKAGDVTFLY